MKNKGVAYPVDVDSPELQAKSKGFKSVNAEPSKRYQLNKIQDLLDIPADRLDAFFVDFKKWHSAGRSAKKLVEVLSEVVAEPLPDDFVRMTWIDDGLHEGKIIFKSDTEVTDLPKNSSKPSSGDSEAQSKLQKELGT